MSLRRRTILSKSLRAPAPVDLTIHAFRKVVVLPLSHDSGRGENLLTIARFVKPLFANMHHHVHAVAAAGGPAEAKRCMPAPRRLHWMASVIVMLSTLSSHSADATFRRRTDLFFICTLR